MILYPDYYCDKVTDITLETLKNNHIKGLILDVDNTLIDFDLNILPGSDDWIENLKANDLKCVILSNSNKEEKVRMVAEKLDIEYIHFATKPLKRGFKMAKEKLKLEASQIAVVGDQIFTDVLGANRCKMFSILVNPLDKKDIWITRFKRPIEEFVIKSYVKKQGKKEE